MKKILLCSLVFLVLPIWLAPLAESQEKTVTDPIADRLSQGIPLWEPFEVTVTRGGRLITESATVFTDETGNYAGVTLPSLLSEPEPISYPTWALEQGWEGEVTIAVDILTNGTVGITKVMKSSGNPELDESVEKAIRQWIFHPAWKEGKAIRECIQLRIRFRLEGN